MERLAWYLPVHFIAVLLAPGGDEIHLQYLLWGFRLLHSLSELASRHTKLEQILLEEVRVTEQILDLVFYMLVLLACYEKESHVTIFVPLLHSSLVACSLHLLTGYISSQWKDLVHVLLAHPKELCKNGGILSLARAVLRLDIQPHFGGSTKVVAGVSRLKSRVLSILLLLCETESISYLDEVASSPKSKLLAESVALEVLNLLKTAFGRIGELSDSFESGYPRGLVLLNSMRLADIFSDDSNFRRFITTKITHVLAEILSPPQEEFLSNWCSTDLPAKEEDAALEYDPFMASGVVLVLLSAGLETSGLFTDANTECTFNLITVPQPSYAQQRMSRPDFQHPLPITGEQERNLFFNKFAECLQLELPKSPSDFALSSNVQKAATICKNLGSLLDHTASLIPNFLNEEDVHLLRSKFRKIN